MPQLFKLQTSHPQTTIKHKIYWGCAEMQGHIFNYRPGAYSGTDEFEKTSTMIISHCCSTMPESSMLHYCLSELDKKDNPQANNERILNQGWCRIWEAEGSRRRLWLHFQMTMQQRWIQLLSCHPSKLLSTNHRLSLTMMHRAWEVGIITEVSMLASQVMMPRKGHFDALFQVDAYLKCWEKWHFVKPACTSYRLFGISRNSRSSRTTQKQ